MIKRNVEISESQSIRLSNMTILGTFLIMLMHLSYTGVPQDALPKFVNDFTHLAVPMFFMVSGYLVAVKAEGAEWYKRLLQHRIKSLVVPYFALNTLFIPFLYVHHNVLKIGNWVGGGMAVDWYAIKRIYGLTPEFHPSCGVLWYVRCLVMFIVITPLIMVPIRKSLSSCVFYISSFLLALSLFESTQFAKDNWQFFYSFFSIRGLFYFSFGGLMSWVCMKDWKLRFLVGLFCLCGGLISGFVPYANALSQLLFISGIWFLMPSVRMPVWVVSSCFALYVFHSPIYMVFNFLINKIEVVKYLVGAMPLFPFCITLVICYSMTFAIRNYCPRLGLILFGGRC